MTVLDERSTSLDERSASGVDVKGITRYVIVGVLSAALGIGLGLGINRVTEARFQTPAQEAMAVRGAAVGEHLDSIWQSGLVQRQAIRDAAQLQARIESGLAQQQAMFAEAQILQGRIESGLAQHDAIVSANSAKEAWKMRGAAMADHLDELIESGRATQQALYGD
jgi:hypothetical protein